MPPERPGTRVWVVQPPSGRRETLAVACVGFGIFGFTAAALASMGSGGPGDQGMPAAPGMETVAFADLGPGDQRLIRSVLDGLGDVEFARAEERRWLPPEDLELRGIPPFARRPGEESGHRWELRQQGRVVDYLGVPTSPGTAPSVLITLQEPDPVSGAEPPDSTEALHHLLLDGTLLHVMIFVHPGGAGLGGSEAVARPPAGSGFRLVLLRRP